MHGQKVKKIPENLPNFRNDAQQNMWKNTVCDATHIDDALCFIDVALCNHVVGSPSSKSLLAKDVSVNLCSYVRRHSRVAYEFSGRALDMLYF